MLSAPQLQTVICNTERGGKCHVKSPGPGVTWLRVHPTHCLAPSCRKQTPASTSLHYPETWADIWADAVENRLGFCVMGVIQCCPYSMVVDKKSYF